MLTPPASALVGRALMEFGAAIALAGVLLPLPGPQPGLDVPAAGWPISVPATLH